ncbi:MAG: hypothetical protein DPW09_26005 [Anaerolineae bacterium]|nr:hypothetical protein [Anaerolineae bacterium]
MPFDSYLINIQPFGFESIKLGNFLILLGKNWNRQELGQLPVHLSIVEIKPINMAESVRWLTKRGRMVTNEAKLKAEVFVDFGIHSLESNFIPRVRTSRLSACFSFNSAQSYFTSTVPFGKTAGYIADHCTRGYKDC